MQSTTRQHTEKNPQLLMADARLTRAGITCAPPDFSYSDTGLEFTSLAGAPDTMLFASTTDSRIRFRRPMRVVFSSEGSLVRAEVAEIGQTCLAATRSGAIARLRSVLAGEFIRLRAERLAGADTASEKFDRLSEFLEFRPRAQARAQGL